jgi:hypothetical protein
MSRTFRVIQLLFNTILAFVIGLLYIVIVIVFVAPYGVIQLYAVLTTGLAKAASRIAQEQVVSTFSTIYFYDAFSVIEDNS